MKCEGFIGFGTKLSRDIALWVGGLKFSKEIQNLRPLMSGALFKALRALFKALRALNLRIRPFSLTRS